MTLPDAPELPATPPYVPRTPWRPGSALLAAIALFIAAQAATYALLQGIGYIDMRTTGVPGAAGWRDTLLLWMFCAQTFMVALTVAAAAARGGRPRDVLQIHPVRFSVLAASVGGLAVLLAVVNGIAYFVNPTGFFSDLRTFQPLILSQGWWLAVLAIGIGAPLSEELLFRGFLLSAFARGAGFIAAALTTNALWTALHIGYSSSGLIEVFLVGIYFSWLLWRTGSLWPALVCHAAANIGYLAVLRWLLPAVAPA